MKKLLFSLIMLPLLLLFGSCVPVARPEPDYREMVIRAAAEGEAEAGREARDFWAAQLRVQRSPLPCPDFDELLLLARLIQTEAGDSRLPEAWRLCVGEVALNRVASPEFPDTIQGVVYQKGQYSVVNTARFASLAPRFECVDAALRLLQGERHMVPGVVYQADYLQGELFSVYFDRRLGNTYFCLSENLDLYP